MAPAVPAGVSLVGIFWDFGRDGGARRDFHVTVPRLGVIVTVLGLVRTQGRFLVSLAASLTRRAPPAAALVVHSLCARAAVPTHPLCSHSSALGAPRVSRQRQREERRGADLGVARVCDCSV